ncbi:hypothetical protein LTR10_012371 [Elasticomyces elasticus]|nr:hypothetical protein LTR10_012371 [Elasticomyces elasticus]KAK4965847.1 hypothetical protein LTR42_011861 [Elasticomyces elasticus]
MAWLMILTAIFLHLSPSVWSAPAAAHDPPYPNDEVYDYIVIGSGPGGGPLAANLAKANYSVLLLEAGSDGGNDLNETIAAWYPFAPYDVNLRWDFFVKHYSDEALNDQYEHLTWKTSDGSFYVGLDPPANATKLGVYYPRSGTLGGCSTHNALAAALPSARDWDVIADITGDETWRAQNMRQYFEKLEKNHYLPPGTPEHGFDGFLDVSLNNPAALRSQPNVMTVLQAAANASGQGGTHVAQLTQNDLNNNDPDRDQQTGIWGLPAHKTPTGRRSSARNAVVDVLNATKADGGRRYNLTLELNALATRIMFSTQDRHSPDHHLREHPERPRAIGVEYMHGESLCGADPRHNVSTNGTMRHAYARREVIVSGGTFNTPQLLKLSGIGSAAELAKFGIRLFVDLPGVGTNLQDNYETGIIMQASQNFTSISSPICTYGHGPDPCLDLWYNGTGPYTVTSLDALMHKTSHAAYGERDLFMWGLTNGFRGFWPAETVNKMPMDPPNTFDFSIIKMHPHVDARSKGTVGLRSADPRDTPEINFWYFEPEGSDADLAAMVEGVEFGRRIYRSVAAPLGSFKESFPCDGGTVGCDTASRIKTQAWSHHATSSCSIGADEDFMAVLDSRFRVRGVEGLRVVDASVFPKIPGGFPVVSIFMVSEKAAQVILHDAEGWK